MHPKIFTVFLLLFFSFFQGQTYSTELYNTDNGLPQNSVKDIIKDRYGFIWLTTENGIVRYDGTNFSVYKNFPLNSQRFTYFYGSIEKDSIFSAGGYGDKILLHGKYPRVIKSFKKDQNIIAVQNHKDYFLYCSNYNYDVSRNLNLYMTFQKGRYFITKNEILYQPYGSGPDQHLKNNPIRNIPRIFAIGERLFRIDDPTKKVIQIEEGKITEAFTAPLLTDTESKIFWSKINGQVFILNRNCFYTCFYEGRQLKVKKLIQLKHFKEDNLVSVYFDPSYKKLYLGSSTKGLQIISISDFISSKRDPLKFSNVFYSTIPYSDSSVITPSGEIYDRNGYMDSKHFRNHTQFFVDYDHQRNIMVRNEKELKIYQKKNVYTSFVPAFTEGIIKDFMYDSQRYYALTAEVKKSSRTEFSGRLIIFKGLSFREVEKKFFFDREVTKLIRKDHDHLLVGSIKGLYKVSLRSDKISKITTGDHLSIRNMVKSKDGHIWITTLGKGFYLLKNDSLIKMPLDSNQNLLSAHTLLEDGKGFFWIPTNNGLYKVHENQLLKYSKDRKHPVDYYRFSKESGFDTNEFNGGGNISGNQLKSGEFVLPSLDGLVFFDPMKVRAYYPGNIYLERAEIDDRELRFKDHLYATQESAQIEIFIDVPYYGNTDNIVMYAKMDGTPNSRWEPIGKNRKFSVFNPGYGKHVLMVKMLVSDRGQYIYKKINIIIPPYFYQTFWFKTLVFLGILLLVYLLVKWRIRFLTRKNQELEKIISLRTKSLSDTVENLETTKTQLRKEIELQKKLIGTITHDITTPIKFITLITGEVIEKKEFDTQRTEKIFNSIYKSSHQLYNFTMTLKEYADIYYQHRSDKSKLYSLYKLVEEKKVLFHAIAENNGTTIINHVSPEIQTWISKNILAAIIHNLLDNSVKFTKNGSITINSSLEKDFITLTLKDTGIGMDDQKIEYYTQLQNNIEHEKLLLQKYGMGLHLVLQLLQMIESKIIFEKNPLQGTSFTLILKNKKDD
ncbi:sensor histidine kinase [Chryseobacterium kwangjuense]|uniref:Histidine kinase n=1 Tax=Chryseobacterium kwangjuense TaxID=267125 RepID=A0A135W8E4_9FLAO|nr:HAMP domain-containing sensor histidine kinase [Chryseobacterium kwangjuense]KXH81119.1 histidine kinase [Chryseobacterium kwangjuense]